MKENEVDFVFFFSSRRRHTRYWRDWSSDVCSSDLSSRRVLRGGSWLTYPARCRSANRSNFNPIFDISKIGRASCRERV